MPRNQTLERPTTSLAEILPEPAPWLRSDVAPSDQVEDLLAEIAMLQATVAERDESIVFLRDMLAERWFTTEV